MKRFSKIRSSSRLTPVAVRSSAIICACRSVGKPGKGCVSISTARRAGPAHFSAARHVLATATPASSSLSARPRPGRAAPPTQLDLAAGDGGRQHVGAHLDPVGRRRDGWRRSSRSTPSTVMVEVPSPSICAPIAPQAAGEVDDLGLARRALDHGRARWRASPPSTVLGRADRDEGELDPAPFSPSRRRRMDIAVRRSSSAPSASSAAQVQVHGARADGAAARQRDARLPSRASSGPSTRIEARILRTMS